MAIKPDKGIKNKLKELTEDPGLLEHICLHVANGGSLIDLCDMWQVRYGDIVLWIHEEKERFQTYNDAMNARTEWARESILVELRRIGSSDHSMFFRDDNTLKDPKEWTPTMRSIVQDVIVDEDGKVKKIKFWNKEKALELLGKNISMFAEHHSITGKITLEDLVASSREEDEQ